MESLFDLTGKTAVITGGAGLLGQLMAKALGTYGAHVVVADVDARAGEAVCASLHSSGSSTSFLKLDIAEASSIQACIHDVVMRQDGIHIWINNAYPRTTDWHLPLHAIPQESWKKNVDDHLVGYCLCSQKVSEQMIKQRTGSIINMASIYGVGGPDFSVYEGTTMTMPAAYAAIKGGIVNFTRYMAAYCGPHNVRVNTISPGGIASDQPASFVEAYNKKTPMGRMATVDDVAGAVVYLASDAAAYVTGHNLVVDGGWSAI